MTDSPRALRVYIVGHTTIMRRLLVAGIKEARAELVGESGTAEKAIREILALQPDFIVFALVLRSGTGFDVMTALHTEDNTAPVTKVVLTSHTGTENRDRALRLGATHFFSKAHEAWRVVDLMIAKAASQSAH